MEDGFPTGSAWVFRMGDDGAAALEAIYEPPKRAGEPPRWQYYELALGGRV
jgi:hypothetical protein